jgi:hypothetical protein
MDNLISFLKENDISKILVHIDGNIGIFVNECIKIKHADTRHLADLMFLGCPWETDIAINYACRHGVTYNVTAIDNKSPLLEITHALIKFLLEKNKYCAINNTGLTRLSFNEHRVLSATLGGLDSLSLSSLMEVSIKTISAFKRSALSKCKANSLNQYLLVIGSKQLSQTGYDRP